MGNIQGGCLCGAVRYSSDAEPVITAVCHCVHCQKQSGSAFSTNLGVPRHSLQIQGVSLKTYSDIGASGQPVYRKFCGECGSPILTDAPAFADLLFIKAGTLDETSSLDPQMHIWCEHRQRWLELPEDIQKFDGNPSTD